MHVPEVIPISLQEMMTLASPYKVHHFALVGNFLLTLEAVSGSEQGGLVPTEMRNLTLQHYSASTCTEKKMPL